MESTNNQQNNSISNTQKNRNEAFFYGSGLPQPYVLGAFTLSSTGFVSLIDGAWSVPPNNWAFDYQAVGRYRITHNIGIRQYLVLTQTEPPTSGNSSHASIQRTNNYFDIQVYQNGSVSDTPITSIIVYGII